MASKKIKRDEKGHPILSGAETFGTVIKPKGGRYQSRATQLKSQASSRLLFLMKKGEKRYTLPPMHYKDEEALQFQNDLARQNEIVRFAYFRNKLNDLNSELNALLESGNKRKIQLLEGTLRKNIAETKDILKELMSIIRNEE